MKNILCYGDSNTWGYDSKTDTRFPYCLRWTGVMANLLGEDYKVYEEGFGGRTACTEDDIWPGANGSKYIQIAMGTTMPLDLVILMLGTNDTKVHLGQEGYSIAKGYELLLKDVLAPITEAVFKTTPKVLVVGPVDIIRNGTTEKESDFFDRHSAEKMVSFREKLCVVAKNFGCEYIDASAITKPGMHDGIHLDSKGHQALGEVLAVKVREMLK